ncbi:hypothetical protein D3C87_2011300 [compost metagenome]
MRERLHPFDGIPCQAVSAERIADRPECDERVFADPSGFGDCDKEKAEHQDPKVGLFDDDFVRRG